MNSRCREPGELETLVFSILPGSMTLKYECNPALISPQSSLEWVQKEFDLGRSPKIGQMRVIPNSKNKYLKNKLGPLLCRLYLSTLTGCLKRTDFLTYCSSIYHFVFSWVIDRGIKFMCWIGRYLWETIRNCRREIAILKRMPENQTQHL